MLNVSKADLSWLQKRGFLKDLDAVNSIWQELSNRCSYSITLCENCRKTHENCSACQKSSLQTEKQQTLEIPSFKVKRRSQNETRKDICITFSLKNGTEIAKMIAQHLTERNYSVCLAQDEDKPFNAIDMEHRVSNSTCLVVVLTAQCLQQLEVIFAMTIAKNYYKHISQVILVHDAGSCFFPGYDEQPQTLLELFSEKAVTFLKCYANDGVDQIIEKFEEEKRALANVQKSEEEIACNIFEKLCQSSKSISLESLKERFIQMDSSLSVDEVDDMLRQVDTIENGMIELKEFCNLISEFPLLGNAITKDFEVHQEAESQDHAPKEDITTRLFLSHKRSTGQGIAGRLYEGLKDRYKIFLDSEAKFKIHNLKQIVENTEVFVFILSPGILQSRWCCEELKSAVANKKKIIIVRDLSYSLPDKIPSEWEQVKDIIQSPDELIWMAEYNNSCIAALKQRIGPKDAGYQQGKKLMHNPGIMKGIKEQGTLVLNAQQPDVVHTMLHFHPSISSVQLTKCQLSADDFAALANVTSLSITKSTFNGTMLKNCKLPRLQQLNLMDYEEKPLITDSELQHIAVSCPNLLQLNLSKCTKITDLGWEYIAKGCPKLQQLSLSGCKNISTELLHLANFPNLQHLDLSHCWLKTKDATLEIIAKACPKLQQLDITKWDRVSDKGLEMIANGCPDLRQLNLAGCSSVTDIGVQHILKVCPKLQQLNLANTKITDDGLRYFGTEISKLHELNLEDCSITDIGLQHIAKGYPNLVHLILHSCKLITDTGFQHVAKGLPNLLQLDLYGSKITDVGLQYITSSCHHLQQLNLSCCFKITESGLRYVATGCPNLKQLKLTYCKETTDAILEQITMGCPLLETLDLSYCEKVTADGLKCIANSLDLKQLNVSNIKATTNEGLQYIANGLANLETLDLSYCPKISDDGLHHIAKMCSNLVNLNMNECSLITDTGLQHIAKGLPNLQQLQLYKCPITDDGLRQIAQGCFNLCYLNINSCSQITEAGKKYFSPSVS